MRTERRVTHFYGDVCPRHVCPNEPHDRSERGEKFCDLCGKHYATEGGETNVREGRE